MTQTKKERQLHLRFPYLTMHHFFFLLFHKKLENTWAKISGSVFTFEFSEFQLIVFQCLLFFFFFSMCINNPQSFICASNCFNLDDTKWVLIFQLLIFHSKNCSLLIFFFFFFFFFGTFMQAPFKFFLFNFRFFRSHKQLFFIYFRLRTLRSLWAFTLFVKHSSSIVANGDIHSHMEAIGQEGRSSLFANGIFLCVLAPLVWITVNPLLLLQELHLFAIFYTGLCSRFYRLC